MLNKTNTKQFRFNLFSRVVIVTSALLLFAEMLLHLDEVRKFLPEPRPYYSDNVEKRLRALRNTIEEKGKVDLLFIGSSIVRTNFRPLPFDEAIFEETGIPVVSFNGGFSDLAPDRVRLYLENFFLKYASLRIVLQGIRYPELAGSSEAEDYKRFRKGCIERAWLDQSLFGKLKVFAMENIQLLYYKGMLTAALQRFYSFNRSIFKIDARGYNMTGGSSLSDAKRKSRIDAIEPPYSGTHTLNKDHKGFLHLKRTINICKNHGIVYILVNVPEHGDKFLNTVEGKNIYKMYISELKKFAEHESILLIDITNGSPESYRNYDDYSDYHHMSAAGADRFTKELASVISLYLLGNDVFAENFYRSCKS